MNQQDNLTAPEKKGPQSQPFKYLLSTRHKQSSRYWKLKKLAPAQVLFPPIASGTKFGSFKEITNTLTTHAGL